MSRRTVLILIILAITVFNISALATIFYYNRQPTKETGSSNVQIPESHYARWFEEQLNLNSEQFEVFRNANRNYHHTGQDILVEMQLIRKNILDELSKENPNLDSLKSDSDKIGELHKKLKNLTIQYYLEMKNVCDKKQQGKLHKIFQAMIDEQGNAEIPSNQPYNN